RPVRGGGAEAEPVRVHPLDVDRRERRAELARDLERDRDAAARDAHDDRVLELDRLGQYAPGLRAVAKERRDPGDAPNAPTVASRTGFERLPCDRRPAEREVRVDREGPTEPSACRWGGEASFEQ